MEPTAGLARLTGMRLPGYAAKPADTRRSVAGMKIGRKPVRAHTGLVGWVLRGPWWMRGWFVKVVMVVVVVAMVQVAMQGGLGY